MCLLLIHFFDLSRKNPRNHFPLLHRLFTAAASQEPIGMRSLLLPEGAHPTLRSLRTYRTGQRILIYQYPASARGGGQRSSDHAYILSQSRDTGVLIPLRICPLGCSKCLRTVPVSFLGTEESPGSEEGLHPSESGPLAAIQSTARGGRPKEGLQNPLMLTHSRSASGDLSKILDVVKGHEPPGSLWQDSVRSLSSCFTTVAAPSSSPDLCLLLPRPSSHTLL